MSNPLESNSNSVRKYTVARRTVFGDVQPLTTGTSREMCSDQARLDRYNLRQRGGIESLDCHIVYAPSGRKLEVIPIPQ